MLTTIDNFTLYTRNFSVSQPKANLLLVHGMGEHCERYTHVAAALNAIDVNVYCFDLRGHGKSSGEKVFINDIAEYREDVETVYRTIPKNLPLFVLGHSMGGLITLDFLLHKKRTDVHGVILSGAALAVGKDITPLTISILKFVGKIFPKLKTQKLDPRSISRDSRTVENYAKDPLIYHEGTKAGMGLTLINAIKDIHERFAEFDYTTLIMHGGDDKIVNPQGSKDLFAQCKSQDKTLQIWEGAYHEIFNEINQDEVIKLMLKWIEEKNKF